LPVTSTNRSKRLAQAREPPTFRNPTKRRLGGEKGIWYLISTDFYKEAQ
jgi:hypothetical protein